MQLTITERCAKKIREFIEADKDKLPPVPVLRISIRGGGCSGFMYDMEWTDEKEIDENNDITFDQHGIRMVSDRKSMVHLNGIEIDYVDDLIKSGFIFNNPNAKGGCGCGESFNV